MKLLGIYKYLSGVLAIMESVVDSVEEGKDERSLTESTKCIYIAREKQ